MPGRFLTDAERTRLSGFPEQVIEADLSAYYTLSKNDLSLIRRRRLDANRLGFALQYCTLRFLGFVPDDLLGSPDEVVEYLVAQLRISPLALEDYAGREQTRTDHLAEAVPALGFRFAGLDDLSRLSDWLLERAMEHDKPTLLFQLAAEHLRVGNFVRPGVTVLERLVVTARERAEQETYRRLGDLLTSKRVAALNRLLVSDSDIGCSRFAWLRVGATSASPKAILAELDKLLFLQRLGAGRLDLSVLNPNRIKFLAQVARRSSAQALARTREERRFPVLLTFLNESVAQVTDEVVDLFDRALSGYDAKARNDLAERNQAVAKAANEKVVLFSRLARVILDEEVADDQVRSTIWKEMTPEELTAAMADAVQIARPLDDNHFDLLAKRYSKMREFIPAWLGAIEFRSNSAKANLLPAIGTLRRLNKERKRRVPLNTALGFVPERWLPFVKDPDGQINRQYWELCLLTELRGALRSGDVWVVGSRRYADPETYLIPRDRWPSVRAKACGLLGTTATGAERLAENEAELIRRTTQLDRSLAKHSAVRIENGELVVSPLNAEELSDKAIELTALVSERLPKLELAELLIEVDSWCGFSDRLTHASGATTRTKDLLTHLYAAILAQACNFGFSRMADAADLSARQLSWTTEWHLREETLEDANAAIINYQHRLPLAQIWGGGTLSSSDGQRFPVDVKSTTASAIPRYFGFGKGLTFYTWTSDQFSQFGTKVITSTVRDATYVLDGLLDNETELAIVEHTTDTAGYTDLVFALFDLLGLQFAPRLRDLGDQCLYRFGPLKEASPAGSLLKGTIKRRLILEHWDDLVRVAASLKMGWVTSSLLISRLQASPRKNALTKALQEHGRIAKTLFVLRYLESEEYRRRINRQLNKGESLHALRRFLFLANEGRIRRRHLEDQTHQAQCLNLVTNAVLAWNTVYIEAILSKLRKEGHAFEPEDIRHLSPAMRQHINPYGKYRFDFERLGKLRPLRQPAVRFP